MVTQVWVRRTKANLHPVHAHGVLLSAATQSRGGLFGVFGTLIDTICRAILVRVWSFGFVATAHPGGMFVLIVTT